MNKERKPNGLCINRFKTACLILSDAMWRIGLENNVEYSTRRCRNTDRCGWGVNFELGGRERLCARALQSSYTFHAIEVMNYDGSDAIIGKGIEPVLLDRLDRLVARLNKEYRLFCDGVQVFSGTQFIGYVNLKGA